MAILGTVRDALGSLDRVTRVVKVLGMVNCAPGMNQTSKVVDGCSELLVEVFGPEIGRHARSAVGVFELPLDFPVEIEVILEGPATSAARRRARAGLTDVPHR